MIKLYEVALSGNCHKARMLLSILGMPYESVGVNLAVGEQRTPQFLAISPFGQVPVLVDVDVAVRDSQAILVYLASRYGGEQWWPQDPTLQARIASWLSTAANEIAASLAILRAHHKWNRPIDVAQAQALANKILPVIDAELTKSQWLVGNSLSIADLAIYPYVALAPEGQINLQSYTAILRWISDVQALPGYVGMPGMWGNAS
jgi:glutathione S-transferase